jgi:ParB-like nuclease domain
MKVKKIVRISDKSTRQANAMKIELWPISRPIPYARNARKISQQAIDKVAASLKEFHWKQPLVVDAEGVIVVGHVRLLAAQKLGMTEVPVHIANDLTNAQVRAYRLMDNRSHEEAEWDYELLGPELLELKDLEFDLELTGFDEDELVALLAENTAGLTDEDEAPAVPEFAITQPGDLWTLGKHRLLCGDAINRDTVERLMKGEKAYPEHVHRPMGVERGLMPSARSRVRLLAWFVTSALLGEDSTAALSEVLAFARAL